MYRAACPNIPTRSESGLLLTFLIVGIGALLALSNSSAIEFRSHTLRVEDQGARPNQLFVEDGTTASSCFGKWLWWPLMAYLFWGMTHTCDIYFMRAIDVITDHFQIPDDVAAATLMALGCNGPELAMNMIAILYPSNIGVGAVIGGEVFNVLVIIGTAVVATPEIYMPLKLGCFTLFRDVWFYVISVAALYWVLHDGCVTWVDALLLCFGSVAYTTVVAMSNQLRQLCNKCWHRLLRRDSSAAPELEDLIARESESAIPDESFQPDPEMIQQWQYAKESALPGVGSVLAIRADVGNRLMDRTHHYDERYVLLADDAVLVSTAVDPQKAGRHLGRCGSGIVYDKSPHLHRGHWHHGGLVNQPCSVSKQRYTSVGSISRSSSADLGIGSMSRSSSADFGTLPFPCALPAEASPLIDLQETPIEVIPIRDILHLERPFDPLQFQLHIYQHDSKDLVSIKFTSRYETVIDAWVDALKSKIIEHRRASAQFLAPEEETSIVAGWAEWFKFPMKSVLAMTIPDIGKPGLYRYLMSFSVSAFWLAAFAYFVVVVCNRIHRDFGISTSILGYTFVAAGTSFPNVISGMIVARQGRATMAVSNALGANVQNVFIALAIPWTCRCCLEGGSFVMIVPDLGRLVLACYATLIPLITVFLCSSCSLPRWSGFLFLLIYVVYIAITTGNADG